jgi:subtilisin family serine protease
MKKLFALLAMSAGTILFTATFVHAQRPPPNSTPPKPPELASVFKIAPVNEYRTGLDAMLARAGARPIRVMFRLNDAALRGERGNASIEASYIAPAAERKSGQKLLSDIMRANAVADIQALSYAPIVIGTVNAAQLRAIGKSGLVFDMEEVTEMVPTLDKSVQRINAPAAWAKSATRGKGQGQIVAVIDTGVKTSHSFLTGRLFEEACFTSTPAWCSTRGPGAGNGQPCPVTGCDHGTHVAGIALGKATTPFPNNGVAPEAKLMAIMVGSQSSSGALTLYNYDIIDALAYIAQRSQQPISIKNKSLPKIAAVNMSLGSAAGFTSVCGNSAFEPAIKTLADLGIATVVSTGNNGFANATNNPACAPSAIAVASVYNTPGGGATNNANYASWVDLLAPGYNVNSSVTGSNTAFGIKGGTSMAAPHVAGAIALLRNTYGWSCDTPDQHEKDLKSTGTPYQVFSSGPTTTHYLINLQKIYTIPHTGPNPC